jgi:DNA modification methylase
LKQSKLPGMGNNGPVDCLGMTFENDDARREHFLGRLKEYLADPEFRKISGFPKATDETILMMSDPPYYTACPNPFWKEMCNYWSSGNTTKRGKSLQGFSFDTSAGKKDLIYQAHGYHTKVPPKAIMPFLLYYTKPGDIVLDGFCGSGMTGVACLMCDTLPSKEKQEMSFSMAKYGAGNVVWGERKCLLSDLSPLATKIANGYNMKWDVDHFKTSATSILDEINADESLGLVNNSGEFWDYIVWSEIFGCESCGYEIPLFLSAYDSTTNKIGPGMICPECGARQKKKHQNRVHETYYDQFLSATRKRPKLIPVRIGKATGKDVWFSEIEGVHASKVMEFAYRDGEEILFPVSKIPFMHMTHERARLDYQGVEYVHDFFLPRQRRILSLLMDSTNKESYQNENQLSWVFEQSIPGLSKLNRHHVIGRANVNQQMNGVFYFPSVIEETSPERNLRGKIDRVSKAMRKINSKGGHFGISTSSCAKLLLDDESVDYIFTDPPFGENIYYSDLNFLMESWHGLITDSEPEAIIDKAKKKGVADYRELMFECFSEYNRVLKKGSWLTIVFSNSHASVWNALTDAIHRSGFIISTVSTMDTGQGSYRQVTSSAVKDNLVINCFKPINDQKALITKEDPKASWIIMDEHLSQLPVWVGNPSVFALNVERTPDRLFDRLLSLYLVAERQIPYSKGEFIQELQNRFVEREGMFFTPNQVPIFERKLLAADRSSGTLPVFMDRRSAIAWLRYELGNKPALLRDLQPRYFAASSSWADKSEPVPELIDLLQDHFVEGENGRWKVPDPKKEAELERARKTRNLKRFNELVASKGRIKEVHADIILVGFAKCFEDNDLETYSSIRNRLPASVLDDEQVSMYKMMLDGRLDD